MVMLTISGALEIRLVRWLDCDFLQPDEELASRGVFVIVSMSDGQTDGGAKTLLEPAR